MLRIFQLDCCCIINILPGGMASDAAVSIAAAAAPLLLLLLQPCSCSRVIADTFRVRATTDNLTMWSFLFTVPSGCFDFTSAIKLQLLNK